MIDPKTLSKARTELNRLARELTELSLEEERCRIRRTRLEGERARIQALIDTEALLARLAAMPDPVFRIEPVNGVQFVKPVATPPPAPVTTANAGKPKGLPSTANMVMDAVRDLGKAERPAAIAEYVRERWWPDAPTKTICSTVWQLAQTGKLACHDGRYGLVNGAGA
jgi:hypothetical protein